MANIPIEVNTGETKTITFHTADTFSTEDITFSITAAGGDANSTLSGFAYCNTPATTATKTADMPGFELVANQRIILQLVTANSVTSNVKLSVNGTDAKPVYIDSDDAGTNFTAGYYVALYNGTNWVLTKVYWSDVNSTLSGIAYCETAAGTASKVGIMPGFALYKNQRIILYLATSNTASSPKLNVNSTGAKPIYIGGAVATTSNLTSGYWLCHYSTTSHAKWNLTKLAFTDTDTTVIDSDHHYQPSTNDEYTLTESASGATAAWDTDVVTGVTVNRDSRGHVTDVSVTSGKIPPNPNTDTKVTSSANHYTPETASGQNKSASASGAEAAWSIDVVKGVTLNTDGKGHVTGISVTSGKIPANPNTDTKVTPAALSTTGTTNYNILLANNSSTPTTNGKPNYATTAKINGKGEITASKFKLTSGNGFLMADGSVDDTVYALESHSHDNYLTSVGLVASDSENGVANVASSSTVFLNSIKVDSGSNATVSSSNKITGSGTVTVSSDGYGNITIAGTGGGGGSTVTLPSSNITLSTTAANYITVDGTTRKIGLPTNAPTSWMGTTQTTFAKGDHLHGNIQSTGALQTTDVAIASGDKLVVTDSSDSNKIARTSLAFGTSTTTFLRNDGTWATPAGSGGGSTVTLPSGNITLSTTAANYITVDGTTRKIGLPSEIPSSWQGTSATTVSKGNHGHGPITNGGYILGNTSQAGGVAENQVLIANGDRIVIGDYSDRSGAHHKLKLTSIVFDGSTTSKFLSRKGTWEGAPIAIANNNAGSVMPIDTINGINSIVNSDLAMSGAQQEILRPTNKDDIIYLLPIAMDENGRLFLPISEAFGAFLLGQNMGYSLQSLL